MLKKMFITCHAREIMQEENGNKRKTPKNSYYEARKKN